MNCFRIQCALDIQFRNPASLNNTYVSCEFPFFGHSQISIFCNGNLLFSSQIRLREQVSVVRSSPSIIHPHQPYSITVIGAGFLESDVCLLQNETLPTSYITSSMLICRLPNLECHTSSQSQKICVCSEVLNCFDCWSIMLFPVPEIVALDNFMICDARFCPTFQIRNMLSSTPVWCRFNFVEIVEATVFDTNFIKCPVVSSFLAMFLSKLV